MFVTKLLRNGRTDYYDILCAYWVGLRLGQRSFIVFLSRSLKKYFLEIMYMAKQLLPGQPVTM